MNQSNLYIKLSALPADLKSEVSDFIDFLLLKRKRNQDEKYPKFGIAKGKLKINADFDEPLDDFKDYM